MISLSMTQYQVCKRCIMDTSDPEIIFDSHGNCNHCNYFFEEISDKAWLRGENGEVELFNLIQKIKIENKYKDYDGIIGISGGVDSSFLLCKLIEWGIRPLALHIDAGWNSEIAVNNIELLCTKLEVDLHTIVVDWESMREVQLAFLKSGVENQDIPQDHAFFAALYKFAAENKITNIFNGDNFATESILPASWGFSSSDSRYLRNVVKRYGQIESLNNYPIVSLFDHYVYYPKIKKIRVVKPLNYINYSKTRAIDYLEKNYQWRYYGQKHGESTFTGIFQEYILPKRFGYYKKRAHLSSLIVSGEISREVALQEMTKVRLSSKEIESTITYVSKKLGLSESQFNNYINAPKTMVRIPNSGWIINFISMLLDITGYKLLRKILTQQKEK